MISNSSARDCLKCSHTAFDCSTPHAVSSFDSSGTHEPHAVPARVHALSFGTESQPSSWTARVIVPLETALHEQICAASGSASTPTAAPPPAGARIAPGSAGSGRPTSARRVLYSVASPTRTPPRRVFPSSVTTSFLYVPVTASLTATSRAPSVAACASPNEATSTPISLSFVDVSGSGKLAEPPVSCAATTSAIA